jgi:murein DD-endopeptidase MepM/ murein hydrolase activator NlpD
VTLVALGSLAPVQAGTLDDLERARRRVSRIEEELEDARGRERAIQADLQAVTTRLAQATAQLEGIRATIQETRAAIRQGDRRVERLQGRLNDRARDAYIDGPASSLQLVLEADSLTDLSDRVAFLEILARDDGDLATGVAYEREQLTSFRGNLKELEEEHAALVEGLAADAAEQQSLLEQQQAVTAEIDEKLSEARDAVKKLRRKYQRELLAAIQAAAAGNAAPVSTDGALKWCPVDRPRSYVDTFGAPRSGGRTHQGNDVFASAGTPIRSPFHGIARESWNTLGGYSVHVYADNGDYVYNAHLSRYAGVNGARVGPGSLVGFVGNTGNAAGTPPHDHFEYHPGGGSAVNPYPYLNAVCGVNGQG